jgi:dihydrofolate synthase/folylpolyglutamate synthase
MDELLERLGNPHLTASTVHVAGTKGKGSTAAMIASVLSSAGYRTGLYTSPHLIDLRERMRVDGRLISKSELVRLVCRLKPEVEAVNEKANYGRLTTFEVLTTLGFMFFAEKKVQIQVVEVGLGGRLDATNVVKPEVCVITTLGLDHTDVLGDTLSKIAAEKAGIIKPGVPIVTAKLEPEAASVIEAFCKSNVAPLIRVGHDIVCAGKGDRDGFQLLEVKGRLGRYEVELPLRGRFQLENAAAAVGALEVLSERRFKVKRENITTGLRRVRWPGRFQLIRRRPALVVDGAHNPQAALELKKAIEDFLSVRKPGRRILVIGMSSDKDYPAVADIMAPLFDSVIATHSRHPRALEAGVLAAEFIKRGSEVVTADSVAEAMGLALEAAQNTGFICATGSLFLAGETLEWAGKPGF